MGDCWRHFGIHQTSVSGQFILLEGMGLLQRERVSHTRQYFTVINRARAEAVANEQPKPANGYIPADKRGPFARARKSGKIINSVFSLGQL